MHRQTYDALKKTRPELLALFEVVEQKRTDSTA